jgi:TetR/AcrR family transcriptional regulator, regulator of cefoperazone and chloramphenicol sensitivity
MAKQELGPESRDKEARMRALVDAAIKLFAEEGYGPVSTRRIAELAGCSETLLFRYFGGKRGLLHAISEGFIETSAKTSLPEFNDAHEAVHGYLLHVFATMRAQSASLKVIIAALVNESTLAQEFENMHDSHVQALATQFRRFQAAGDIAADVDLDAFTTGLEQMGFAVGFLMQIIYRRPQSELEAIADTFANVLAAGLQPNVASAPISASLRQQTVRRAVEASQGLDKIITLLESWPTPTSAQNGEAEGQPGRIATRGKATTANSRRR